MILDDTILTDDGPYLEFVFQESPVIDSDNSWPSPHSYAANTFLRMSDSLLGVLCDLSGDYSPFDPYDLTNLTSSEDLQQFISVLSRWISVIHALPDAIVKDKCSSLFEFRMPELTGADMKLSLVETLSFIIMYARKALQKRYTIIIVGI